MAESHEATGNVPINAKGTGVIHHRNKRHLASDTASSSATDLVQTFLVAWEDATTSYERLLESGLTQGDQELSRDQNYARLLRAGQSILWIGGHRAIASAARLIARHVPGGSPEHFDRLWCGLMPQGSG
jgi:hypothetical protein